MEAILGIVASFLGPAVQELGKCFVEPIKRQFNYLCCFNNNVQNLHDEAQKLEEARHELQSTVTTAQNKAEIVVPRVQTWLDEVSEIQTKLTEIDDEIATTRSGGRSTVGSRFSLSKKVKKMAEAMKELRESGSFTTVSDPPPPAALTSIRLRSSFEFDSRKRVEDEVMASWRDEKTYMVGICGMGGVGKTIMAKTIMQRAREELGFEETVMAVVSQDVDKLKIQDDIAKSLGLTLSEGSLSSKAHQLRTRLKARTRKSLVVIDDVWEKLELEELGIPCNSDCKVLITSRNSHILEAMDVEKLHAVQVLSETEAWELFKSKAGSYIERENVVDVARQVVDECKGLPIALVTVGVALKNKASIGCWNTALCQLKSANPRHMPEFIKSVYQPIRLSYDLLESEEQKTLFLLCCLFPEDDDIPVETLANICMGLLQLNEDMITSSRDTTSFLIDKLKSRFLLLDSRYTNHVKMHDVVRDVAIFIAAEEKRIKCNECTWISPNIGERIGAHGASSLFPNLRLLWIDRHSRDKELEIHDDFLEGKSELNVFWIKCQPLQRLPETIGLLKNLRTLVLEWCQSLESISVVGELVNLEILICRFCLKIESLPVEIGRLSRLRLLELSGCQNLKTIAPGIISNLIKLEELIVEHFGGWEARIVEGERKNASLCELEHLSSLTNLKIVIRDNVLAAEELRLSRNLLKFHIIIGDRGFFYSTCEKTMELKLRRDINLGKWIHECVRNVEYMSLQGDGSTVLDLLVDQNLELDIIDCSSRSKLGALVNTPFHQLKHLRLQNLRELEEICDISNLKKLSFIRIVECGRLRSLFSLPVMESGGCFLQLERIEIESCDMMEQVLMWNEEEQNQTNIHIPLLLFPKLKLIKLDVLPRLTSFSKGIQGIEFPQLAQMYIEECPLLKDLVCSESPDDHHDCDSHFICKPHKAKFGKLSKLEVRWLKNWCLQAPIDSFTSLTELVVSGLKDEKSLFSFSINESSCLPQLERLEISYCDMMEQVILWKEEENQMDIHITLFPKLKILNLSYLPRLTSLSKGIENIQFHLPPEMYIENCPLLESCASKIADQNDDYRHLFCKPHHKVEFDRLKELKIDGPYNDKMRRNWCPQIPMIELFGGVCNLDVSDLKGMESLFPCSIARMMQHIKTLVIRWCQEMVRVIEDDVEIEIETTPPVLLFPNLESLSLDGLPKLRSFCEWRCGLQLPSLFNLIISHCGMMEELTSGPLYAPKLEAFQIDDKKFNDKDVNTVLLRREEERKTLLEENTEEEIKQNQM